MVDRLRAALGEPLAGGSPLPAGLCADDVPRQHALEFNQRGALHRFPAVEALAGASAEELLSLGLGYRARFVRGAARQLREGGGRAWLEALAAPACGRATAEAELRRLPGVGPKVAACVALLGLGHADAVPVDVHVARLAARSLAPPPLAQRLRGGALTPRVHAEVGELFRERYGAFAGWAQTLLFAAERERARPARR
ncbi:unnamed protein product [Prorocentrum cordatum]|nr:unnamed protein product [Polarella glacialis]